jgi:hypothetical protein
MTSSKDLSQFFEVAPPSSDLIDTFKASLQRFSQVVTGATHSPVTVKEVTICDTTGE